MNLDKKMIKNNIPRIRFNNFEAFWVEKRIADIVKISAGGDVDKVKLKESKISCYCKCFDKQRNRWIL